MRGRNVVTEARDFTRSTTSNFDYSYQVTSRFEGNGIAKVGLCEPTAFVIESERGSMAKSNPPGSTGSPFDAHGFVGGGSPHTRADPFKTHVAAPTEKLRIIKH